MTVALDWSKWSTLFHRARDKAFQGQWAAPWRRDYSGFVRLMKMTLPALAVAILGLVVIWARLAPQADAFKIGFAHLDQDAVKSLSMMNPRYFGIDENNHPYSVTAEKALQHDEDQDLIDLDQPKADFSSKSGAGVVVTADHGLFHQHSQLLDLTGNVNLFHDQGYELHTEQATIDIKNNSAWGTVPVDGQGPQGHLEGEGFRISDKGEKVLVTGRSSMTLHGVGGGQGNRPPSRSGAP